ITMPSGPRFRILKPTLRRLLGGHSTVGSSQACEDRRKALAHAAQQLQEIERRGDLTRTVHELVSDYVHVCTNRLVGQDLDESELRSLWHRTHESLQAFRG